MKEAQSEEPVVELPPQPWWRHKWVVRSAIGAAVSLITIAALFLVGVIGGDKGRGHEPQFTYSDKGERQISESEAVKAGKQLSNGQCKGEGVTRKLSVSPMKSEDFSIIVPYGLMVGGHVTPIDHQYFSPKDYKSAPHAYEVRAMADSQLVDITTRSRPFGREYRLVFSISCTFLYYYDLVTSLTPELEQLYQESQQGTIRKSVNVSVKAGQLIGRIGGQTLDFAVWDTTKPLSGFLVPKSYEAERWKLYTADPLNYYTDELKALILSRYVRKAEPISGKIDYDINGRLMGNWFVEGTNGYYGDREAPDGAYWSTHLSFAPNLYVPDWFVISIGDFVDQRQGKGSQFVSTKNAPNPKDVSTATGLVKYDLVLWSYVKGNGSSWDQNSLTDSISIRINSQDQIRGCALAQMLEDSKLKFEAFKGKTCAQVPGFTPAAKIYTR